jgi:hypothetical protein
MLLLFYLDEQRARHEHFSSSKIFFGSAFNGKLTRRFEIEAMKLDVKFVSRHPSVYFLPIGKGT